MSFRQIFQKLDLQVGDIVELCQDKIVNMKQKRDLEISMSSIMDSDILQLIRDNDFYRGLGVVLHSRFNSEAFVY